jgi:2-succinyl-5-enolpyruvyl-6-hydroxy-3-cyclohexene-1-carboxylate synthase
VSPSERSGTLPLDPARLARANATSAGANALLDELARGGLRDVCVCPGSRSAPLAVAAAANPRLRVFVHVDERSAAFFALGLAKAGGAPVALVCTSGTAAANFLPAVAEADRARVPLVLLTADRPPGLRAWGAPQTLRQPGLYAPFARFEAETEVPTAAGYREAPLRALACRALHEATGRMPGPVHLNVPFDEPLDPVDDPAFAPRAGRTTAGAWATRHVGLPTPSPDLVEEIAGAIAATGCGLIACGPQRAGRDLCEAIARLAAAAGWPVMAELASQVRCGPHVGAAPVLATVDAWLRSPRRAAALAPEVVLRFGAPPTSKAFHAWLDAHPAAELWAVDAAGGRLDPQQRVTRWLEVDAADLCRRVARRLGGANAPAAVPRWLEAFLQAEKCARAEIDRQLGAPGPLDGPTTARVLADALPAGASLYLSNSLAIRDAETVVPVGRRPLRVLANRGVNGIDGVVSSALGAAAAGAGPLALLVGDLAFLHDLPALARARHHDVSATIVVLHDDGGGIFSQLPIAAHDGAIAFEALFRVRHGARLGPIAQGFGLDHVRVSEAAALRAALARSLATPGVQIVEVPLDADRNAERHRALFEGVARAVGAEGVGR